MHFQTKKSPKILANSALLLFSCSYDDVVGPVPPPRQQESEEEAVVSTSNIENYETIYALLSARSPGFRHRFSERLAQRLAQLQKEQLEQEVFPEDG